MSQAPDKSPETPETTVPIGTESLPMLVGRLARVMASPHFPTADRAALKRHAPNQPPPLAFYRLWLRQLDSELPPESLTAAWALLVWGLALMGTGAHREDRPLGRALAEAGFSESRLERLLAADSESRESLFASMVRYMAAKGEAFDWTDAARLLLAVHKEKRDLVHRRIASAFYRHQPRTEKE